jgi:hypothetical protein
MTKERSVIISEITELTKAVMRGSLEQVQSYSKQALLSNVTPLREGMLELSIYNKANPDVFRYLYHDVFKARSPDIKRGDGAPIVITAALVENAAVLIFLAEKGVNLRPKNHTRRTVFDWIGNRAHELLYEQLLVIEAKHKPELRELQAHNMRMIGRPEQTKNAGSSSVLGYISSFWGKPAANLQPEDIREILMTKSLREVKNLSPTMLRDFKGIYDGTTLHLALKNISHPEVFAYLYNDVFEMSSPHYLKKQGISLIVFAASYNNQQAIKFLMEHGANLQDTDPYGRTALQIITTCDPEFAQSLPQFPIDTDNTKFSALGSQAPGNIRKRNPDKNYGTIDGEEDLRAPLLAKISPPGL